jgi:predicted small secreted protein
MKNILKIASIILAVAMLPACNTIYGLGQDLQNLGSAIDKSGDKKSDSNASSSGNSGVVVTPVK